LRFLKSNKKRDKDTIIHPATFPEELVSEFIRFFTKKGAIVLDPMVGTGSTLISCVETGRNGIGIELLEKYALIAKKRLLKKQIKDFWADSYEKVHIELFVGDAFDIDKLNLPQIDYCITSPPYWNMLREKGFETQLKRKEKKLDVYYSDDPRDLGNISDYNEFLNKLVEIYRKVYDVLKPGGYMTVIVKNVKKKNKVYPLAWDLANRLSSFFRLKDEKIWCQDEIKLAPYGYKNAWVSNTVHHYCLNFRKE
jgi:DNA modification methylase